MKMKFNFMIIIASSVLNLCSSDTEIHGKYFGRGVCSVLLNDEKKVLVNEIHFHDETTWELCWSFPPWCEVVSRQWFDFGPSFIDIPHDHLKLKCCPGYRSNEKFTACMPQCSSLCRKGYCIDVNVCSSCKPGYAGSTCDEILSNSLAEKLIRNSSAEKLISQCECADDNYVCTPNGTCVCAPGFKGTDCDTIIEPSNFIVDPGPKPSCFSVYLQVIGLLWLLIVSFFVIVFYIKRYFKIVRFRPLVDYSRPSTSHSAVP